MNIFMFFCLIMILLLFNLLDSVNSKGLSMGRMLIFNLVISNLMIWSLVMLILKFMLFSKLSSNVKSGFKLGWMGFVLVNCFMSVFSFLIFWVCIF